MEKWIGRINLFFWILAAGAVSVGAGWRLVWGENIPPQIPLFYSKPWGDEQLANPGWIWGPIGITITLAIVASLIVRRLNKYPVLQVTIATTVAICQLILTAAIIRVIILVM